MSGRPMKRPAMGSRPGTATSSRPRSNLSRGSKGSRGSKKGSKKPKKCRLQKKIGHLLPKPEVAVANESFCHVCAEWVAERKRQMARDTELADLRDELTRGKTENSLLKSQVEILQHQVDALKKVDEKRREQDEARHTMLDQMTVLHAAAADERDALKKRNKELDGQLTVSKNIVETLQSQLASTWLEVKRHADEAVLTKVELDSARQERDDMAATNSRYSMEISKLQAARDTNAEALVEAYKSVDLLEDERARLSTNLSTMHAIHENMLTRSAAQQTERNQLASRLAETATVSLETMRRRELVERYGTVEAARALRTGELNTPRSEKAFA